MPRRPKPGPGLRDRDPDANTPTQQDEGDILAEAGAELDQESGDHLVDESKIRELGAVDAASVRENRRLARIVDKKRQNKKDVPFNTNDPIIVYETILQYWSADTVDISVKRLTGSEVRHLITSRPLSGAALYEAIRGIHGQHGEAEYEVRFLDSGRGQYRGIGRITMPDTRAVPQQGQPMNPTYPPNGAPPPQYAPPQGYASQAQPQAPQQPPTVQVMPSPFDPSPVMSLMSQMLQMFQQMQTAAQPAPILAQPQFVPPPQQGPTMMPPMPSPQASPAEMTAWMQQAFQLFQQAQTQAVRTAPYSPPPPAYAPPPSPPQAGFTEMMTMMEQMEQMFKMFHRMQGPGVTPSPGAGPYRGPRPPYYPQGDAPPYQGAPNGPPPPPQRQQTPAEQFREAMTVVRGAVDAVQEINTLLPGQGQQETPFEAEEDDSPIKIVETGIGKMKLALNKDDGALRWAETGMMALPDVLKWIGEQHEVIQKANKERQLRQQQPAQQLPPGYVEVGPGYQPPPGYVAVAIDQPPPQQQQQPLPPPPVHMPPPIQSTPVPPPGRQTWGAPTIPGSEGENR